MVTANSPAPKDRPRQRSGALRGAIAAACLYGSLATVLIVLGIRTGGEGQIGVMLWLTLTGLPMTLFGLLAFDHAGVRDLVIITLIGELQWTVVGAYLGRWVGRRIAARRLSP